MVRFGSLAWLVGGIPFFGVGRWGFGIKEHRMRYDNNLTNILHSLAFVDRDSGVRRCGGREKPYIEYCSARDWGGIAVL